MEVYELIKDIVTGGIKQKLLILLYYTIIILGIEILGVAIGLLFINKLFNHIKNNIGKYQNEQEQLKKMKCLYRLRKYYCFFNLNIEIFAPVLIITIFVYVLGYMADLIKSINSNNIPLVLVIVDLLAVIIITQMLIYGIITIVSYVGGKEKFKQNFMQQIKNYLERMNDDSYKMRELKEKLKLIKKSKRNNQKELTSETDYFKKEFKDLNDKLDTILDIIKTNQKKRQ